MSRLFISFSPQNFAGAKFAIETLFTTQAGTGTGEIDIQVITVDGFPYGYDELAEAQPSGSYNITITDQATPRGCDQGPCEEWLPGNYIAIISKFKKGKTHFAVSCP